MNILVGRYNQIKYELKVNLNTHIMNTKYHKYCNLYLQTVHKKNKCPLNAV